MTGTGSPERNTGPTLTHSAVHLARHDGPAEQTRLQWLLNGEVDLRPGAEPVPRSVEPDHESHVLWAMHLAKRSHHVPDRGPVGLVTGDRPSAARAGPICLVPVGGCQLGPADPCRSVRVLWSAPRVERAPQSVRGVLRQTAVLGQRPEPEGIADAEEAGEGVVGVARIEEEEVNGGVPDRVRIAHQTPGGVLAGTYRDIFGDALPEPPLTVEGSVFPADGLLLDGHELFAYEVGHSDTYDTSVLHAPSLDLVIAGDVVYNNVHQYLGEGRDGGLEAWHRALDKVAALKPRFVVAGHKDTQRGNPASDIEETRRYLDVGAVVLEQSTNPAEFFNAMKQRYPERVNPWAIWLSALQLFGN